LISVWRGNKLYFDYLSYFDHDQKARFLSQVAEEGWDIESVAFAYEQPDDIFFHFGPPTGQSVTFLTLDHWLDMLGDLRELVKWRAKCQL
jgi:hypothetical protein